MPSYSDAYKFVILHYYRIGVLLSEDMASKRERLLEKARMGVSEAYSSADHFIIQAVNAYNEIEKTRNLIYERLEEWYAIHFPEVKLQNHDTFARLITVMKSINDVTEEQLTAILGDKGAELYAILKEKNQGSMSDDEYSALKELANSELTLSSLQESLDRYIKTETERFMPNVSYLIDYKIAAELLSKAGSLSRLATMPSGTIQLLGAEKALFKHMKFGSRPPKYGLLYKMPIITNASMRDRGRIARSYATKISIAARADAYTKRFIADKLKESLDKTLGHMRSGNSGSHE